MEENSSKNTLHGNDNRMHAGFKFLQFVIDVGPVLVFLLANYFSDIFVATGFLIVSAIVSLIVSKLVLKKIAVQNLLSVGLVVFFGTITLLFHDETFIKVKPTFLYLLMGVILLGGLFFEKLWIKYILVGVPISSRKALVFMTVSVSCVFFLLAGLNELIWRNFSTEFWIAFKIWGFVPVTALLVIIIIYLTIRMDQSHGLQDNENKD